MATISEEAQSWQLERIEHDLYTRRVSFRAAQRIIAILDEQPMIGETLPNQTETARMLREWTDSNNSKR